MFNWKNKLKVRLYKALVSRRRISFSQCAEDKYIDQLLGYKERGCYVDVGAYHPENISNTYLFYLRGWHGLNIEPTPGRIKQFEKTRPRDINLNVAVGSRASNLDFYCFEKPELNTFDVGRLPRIEKWHHVKPSSIVKVELYSLKEILNKYGFTDIDFLNIDVEGFEDEILTTMNFKGVNINVIAVEKHVDINKIQDTALYTHMIKHNYFLDSKLGPTYIFKKSK